MIKRRPGIAIVSTGMIEVRKRTGGDPIPVGAGQAASIRAKQIMHGKTSLVTHDDTPLFTGIKSPFPAGRYHSLAINRDTLPEELLIDAQTEDGEIMGIHHREHATYGVQFHPESVLTPLGKRLLRNFITIVDAADAQTIKGTSQ